MPDKQAELRPAWLECEERGGGGVGEKVVWGSGHGGSPVSPWKRQMQRYVQLGYFQPPCSLSLLTPSGSSSSTSPPSPIPSLHTSYPPLSDNDTTSSRYPPRPQSTTCAGHPPTTQKFSTFSTAYRPSLIRPAIQRVTRRTQNLPLRMYKYPRAQRGCACFSTGMTLTRGGITTSG